MMRQINEQGSESVNFLNGFFLTPSIVSKVSIAAWLSSHLFVIRP